MKVGGRGGASNRDNWNELKTWTSPIAAGDWFARVRRLGKEQRPVWVIWRALIECRCRIWVAICNWPVINGRTIDCYLWVINLWINILEGEERSYQYTRRLQLSNSPAPWHPTTPLQRAGLDRLDSDPAPPVAEIDRMDSSSPRSCFSGRWDPSDGLDPLSAARFRIDTLPMPSFD